jgi:anti-sigma regulatory factor (Ser/Thr protein kinase)
VPLSEAKTMTLLALTLERRNDLPRTIRLFVEELCLTVAADASFASRVAMTVHELVENTNKYASKNDGELSIAFETESRAITIRTSNTARPEDIEVLRRHFAEMSEMPDAQEHYQVLMHRTARWADGSRLGIGRVRAEADMTLSLLVEGDRIEITAVTHTGERE